MLVRNDLRQLTRDDYARIRARYLADASHTPGVLAAFGFGDISSPGISDLDLLLVISDEIGDWSLRRLVQGTQSDETTRYLFTHEPLIVPHSIAARFRYVHTAYGLTQIWGDSVDIPEPREEHQFYISVAEYIDFAFLTRCVLRALAQGEISLRWILLLLKSIAHSADLAASITLRSVDDGIAQRVALLREEARSGRPDVSDAAVDLLARGLSLLRETDRSVEVTLFNRRVIRDIPFRDCISHTDGRYCLFQSPYTLPAGSGNGGQPRAGWLWRAVGVDPSLEVFPGFYLAQFSGYGRGQGPYASLHRATFGAHAVNLIRDSRYLDVLVLRLQIVQKMYDVVQRGGLLPRIPLGVGVRSPHRTRLSRRRRWLRHLAAQRHRLGSLT